MAATSLHVTCSHCGSKNRLPGERLQDDPKCGKCKKPVFSPRPLTLTGANVAAVLNHNDLPVLVDCWASWCAPCKTFAPIFDQAAGRWQTSLRLAKLNTEKEQALAGRWQIRSIPTLILFRQGKEVARVAGALPLPKLQQWLQQQGVTL